MLRNHVLRSYSQIMNRHHVYKSMCANIESMTRIDVWSSCIGVTYKRHAWKLRDGITYRIRVSNSCLGFMHTQHSLVSCPETMSRFYGSKSCARIMSSNQVPKPCVEIRSWNQVPNTCIEIMSKHMNRAYGSKSFLETGLNSACSNAATTWI